MSQGCLAAKCLLGWLRCTHHMLRFKLVFIEPMLNGYFSTCSWHSILFQNVLHNVEFGLTCSSWWFKNWYSCAVPLVSRRDQFMSTRDKKSREGLTVPSSSLGSYHPATVLSSCTARTSSGNLGAGHIHISSFCNYFLVLSCFPYWNDFFLSLKETFFFFDWMKASVWKGWSVIGTRKQAELVCKELCVRAETTSVSRTVLSAMVQLPDWRLSSEIQWHKIDFSLEIPFIKIIVLEKLTRFGFWIYNICIVVGNEAGCVGTHI